jgi:hypothetical protein
MQTIFLSPSDLAFLFLESPWAFHQKYRQNIKRPPLVLPKIFNAIDASIKLKYFIGLMRYLERIDLSQSDTLYDLKDLFGEQSIDYALKEMIDFFEEVEMYENCALLMRFYKVFFPKNSWKLQD